ncbi:hypothetical protein LINGRAHAP2_LOCUS29128 [Linum grandiflorum]
MHDHLLNLISHNQCWGSANTKTLNSKSSMRAWKTYAWIVVCTLTSMHNAWGNLHQWTCMLRFLFLRI